MKTPFSPLCAAAIAAAAFFVTPSSSASAATTALGQPTAAEVFARNREALLAANASVVDGWLFSIGRAKSEERLGPSVGFGKARAMAFRRIDQWLFSTAPWPANATPDERFAAWKRLAGENDPATTLRGIQTVLEEHPGPDLYVAVLAVEEEKAAAQRPDSATLADVFSAVGSAAALSSVSAASPDPRDLFEIGGVSVNETMAEGQF